MSLLQVLKTDARKRYLLIAASVAFVAIGASQAMYGPFYGVLRQIFDLSASRVALTTTFHFMGGTVALLASSAVVRRIGGVPLALSASVILTLGFAAVAAAPSFMLVLAGALLLGLGFGGLQVLNFMIARIFTAHRAAALNLLNAMFSIGAIIAPLAAAPFVTRGLYRPLFVIAAALSVAVLILLLRLPREFGEEPAAAEAFPRRWGAVLGVVGFLLLYFFYVGAEAGYTNWIPTHLDLNYGVGIAARMAGFFWAALTLGRLAAIPASERLRPPVLVMIAAGGSAASALLAQIPAVAPYAYLIAGFFLGPIFPAGLAWIADRFPMHSTPISAFVLAGGGFGAVTVPPLIGLFVDAGGATVIPFTIAAVLGACLLTAIAIRALSGVVGVR
jgi:fucose permease